MKWSEKDFRARVRAHAEHQGLTLTELLERAGVTEDYLRKPPEGGRNISGILKIAEVLDVNPAELLGWELPNPERRAMIMVAQVMRDIHLHLNGLTLDLDKLVVAIMAAVKESEAAKPSPEPPTHPAAAAKPKRSG